jgi:plastocyanin
MQFSICGDATKIFLDNQDRFSIIYKKNGENLERETKELFNITVPFIPPRGENTSETENSLSALTTRRPKMFDSRKRIRSSVLTCLLVMLLCSLSEATIYDVSIIDFAFDPQVETISLGDTVRWTNNGSAPHTSTSDQPLWDSGTLTSGQSFSFQFNTVGTFPYHCSIHPAMTGTIGVTPTVPVFSYGALIVVILLLSASGVWLLRRRRPAIDVRTHKIS